MHKDDISKVEFQIKYEVFWVTFIASKWQQIDTCVHNTSSGCRYPTEEIQWYIRKHMDFKIS